MPEIWTPTATAVNLARQHRETGDAAILPILGDAIEDANQPDLTPGWAERARESSPAVASMVLSQCGQRCRTPEKCYYANACESGCERVADIGEARRAVCEDREWDAPRLLYADLIEPSDPQRAEFVRVQVKLATVPREHCATDCCTQGFGPCRWCILRRRERELFEADAARWLDFPGYRLAGFRNGCEAVLAGSVEPIAVRFHRGSPAEITCTWADWPRIERDVYWHPGQLMRCEQCRGGRGFRLNDAEMCPTCNGTGTGTVPRPFPATACPLECVRLTDIPNERETGTINQIDWKTGMRSYYRWPGLQFTFADQTQEAMG